jgi:hypothetical protein
MTADHYAAAGRGWATGAKLAYGPIAAELIVLGTHQLAGHAVLDAGADTGTASWALAAQPAKPIATDLSRRRRKSSGSRPRDVRTRR